MRPTTTIQPWLNFEDAAAAISFYKAAFDALHQQKEDIEAEVGSALGWQRLENKQASRIALDQRATITAPSERLEESKQWALETMLGFVDALQPKVKELQLD